MQNGKYLPNIPTQSQVLPWLDHPKEDKHKFTWILFILLSGLDCAA